MARQYIIGGVRFYRRSIIRLTLDERAQLASDGAVVLCRPVEWPLAGWVPNFARAYEDPGGTDIWGPGPYLKVPNFDEVGDWERVNRVLCPWGYPPERLRVSHRPAYLRLAEVRLEQSSPATWTWLLRVEPWPASTTPEAGASASVQLR